MKPVLFDVPERVETERLILRAPQSGDGVHLHTAIKHSFASLSEWIFDHIPEMDEAEEIVRKSYARFLLRERLEFYMFEKASGLFVGSCQLLGIQWRVKRFEIGYWITDSASKKGYMTEAVHQLTDLAFRHFGANRVELRCDSKNGASRKVAERCGYHLEAILINDYMKPFAEIEEIVDTCLYAQVRLNDGSYGYPTHRPV
ncbi:GNAT family N-acetyltransferase [Alicyclobacillus fodiniaquatilis]|uniref:GNAT family N-acetyltransferase n=1 Tax=Alicyclobacillus fodiniaquatilis TaxID=1661150 RepID=A0ABW4JNB5_9BACL